MTLILILGSQSPRRKEILSYFKIPFEQRSSSFHEESVPFHGDPASYVCTLSRGKALAIPSTDANEIILTADTAVYREGKIYNKPADEEEAVAMLKELSGHWHSVHTALTLKRGHEEHTASEETRVLFHPLTDKQRKQYVQGVHTIDKAGGYAIQGTGSIIVQRMEGCYYNAMGMPINTLAKLLHRMGIDLWEHLR